MKPEDHEKINDLLARWVFVTGQSHTVTETAEFKAWTFAARQLVVNHVIEVVSSSILVVEPLHCVHSTISFIGRFF
jgi:hypothetical protein